MFRYVFLLIGFLVCFNLYSAENGPEKYDFASVLNKAIFRLNCHPDDRLAIRKIQKTYFEAISYYGQEIDLLQVKDDSLKWNKTLDLMQKTNDLSDEIRYNSAANEIICDPKVYTSEIDDITQKAVAEAYDLGMKSLSFNTKQNQKEAFNYFTTAGKLNPLYKDVGHKILQAKKQATVNVVLDKVPAYSNNKNLFTEKFYQTVLYKLQTAFLNDQFVHIYSVNEEKSRKIDLTAWEISISFINFDINNTSTFENTLTAYTSGVAEIKVFSPTENKEILNTRVPAQYVWQSYRPGIRLDLQDLFDSFSLSVAEQIVELLTDNLNQSYLKAKFVP